MCKCVCDCNLVGSLSKEEMGETKPQHVKRLRSCGVSKCRVRTGVVVTIEVFIKVYNFLSMNCNQSSFFLVIISQLPSKSTLM